MSFDGLKKKRAYKPKPKIPFTIERYPGYVRLMLPLITVSEANSTEHWTKKAARHKEQKRLVITALLPIREITLPCRIIVTRLAPRSLDKTDNLPTSQKYIIDALCEKITGIKQAGRADDHPEISLEVHQEKSKVYGVRVDIYHGLQS